MISDPAPEKAGRATEAMLAMTKSGIAAMGRRIRGRTAAPRTAHP
jgi:hypothetical protein